MDLAFQATHREVNLNIEDYLKIRSLAWSFGLISDKERKMNSSRLDMSYIIISYFATVNLRERGGHNNI